MRSIRRARRRVDVVAVGGINTGRDAYVAHLTGAKAVQVGSALIKEGAGALGRIDRELDALLGENGKRVSVDEIRCGTGALREGLSTGPTACASRRRGDLSLASRGVAKAGTARTRTCSVS